MKPRQRQVVASREAASPVPLRTVLRLAYLAAAEADARERRGRPMTAQELERAVRRYPGD